MFFIHSPAVDRRLIKRVKNINFEPWVIDSHDRLKKDHLGLEPGRQSPPLWGKAESFSHLRQTHRHMLMCCVTARLPSGFADPDQPTEPARVWYTRF